MSIFHQLLPCMFGSQERTWLPLKFLRACLDGWAQNPIGFVDQNGKTLAGLFSPPMGFGPASPRGILDVCKCSLAPPDLDNCIGPIHKSYRILGPTIQTSPQRILHYQSETFISIQFLAISNKFLLGQLLLNQVH